MRALPQGMYARVRPACACDSDCLARRAGERFLNQLLHRQAVILPLPAGIRRAVVLDRQQNPPRHQKIPPMCDTTTPSSTIRSISASTAP